MAGFDEFYIVDAFNLYIDLQPKSFLALRFANVNLGVDSGIPSHFGLTGLAGYQLESA